MNKYLLLLPLLFAQVEQRTQIAVPCKVISVHDGDTLTCTVTFTMNVRLLDCWAPELREAGGKESRDNLVKLADGKKGTLIIPLGETIGDSMTLGRVLGRVVIDGQEVSDAQVKNGFAKKSK